MHTAQSIDTPDGPFTVVENANGDVVASGWSGDASAVAARAGVPSGEVCAGACASSAAVAAFYAGDRKALDRVAVALNGTRFQMAVWEALRAIPAGEVWRYGELAAALGTPGASRAVGAACGRNAVALFVPCHRVVGASGALTGFAWGVEIKRSLLAREGAPLAR